MGQFRFQGWSRQPRVMGCCCSGGRQQRAAPAAGGPSRSSRRSANGYTPEHFGRHHLVPVEGYACRRPHGMTPNSRQRREELEKEVSRLNELLTEALQEAAPKNRRRGRRGKKKAKSNAPPPEAICRVFLQEARYIEHQVMSPARLEMDGPTRIEFALKDEPDWPIDFEIDGKLIFPPDAPREDPRDDPATRPARSRRRRKAEEEEIPDRMVLGIVLKARVDKNEDRLLVTCEDMKVESTEAMQGDPMIDSWLPCDDVLNDIQKMLSDRLSVGISGLTEDLRV